MSNKRMNTRAINAMLEILELREQIDRLNLIVNRNLTVAAVNSDWNEVNVTEMKGRIVKSDYVGHRLLFGNNVGLHLHTEGYEDRLPRKIFSEVYQSYKEGGK